MKQKYRNHDCSFESLYPRWLCESLDRIGQRKKSYDKREDLKRKDVDRQIDRTLKISLDNFIILFRIFGAFRFT